MLEPIRAFARARLEEAGEADAAAARHLAWCASLADSLEDAQPGTAPDEAYDLFGRELDNFRVALVWAASHSSPDGTRLAGAVEAEGAAPPVSPAVLGAGGLAPTATTTSRSRRRTWTSRWRRRAPFPPGRGSGHHRPAQPQSGHLPRRGPLRRPHRYGDIPPARHPGQSGRGLGHHRPRAPPTGCSSTTAMTRYRAINPFRWARTTRCTSGPGRP